MVFEDPFCISSGHTACSMILSCMGINALQVAIMGGGLRKSCSQVARIKQIYKPLIITLSKALH
jgi:hypothetical protein